MINRIGPESDEFVSSERLYYLEKMNAFFGLVKFADGVMGSQIIRKRGKGGLEKNDLFLVIYDSKKWELKDKDWVIKKSIAGSALGYDCYKNSGFYRIMFPCGDIDNLDHLFELSKNLLYSENGSEWKKKPKIICV